MNLKKSFTLCPAPPSDDGNERKSRVIPGTIRRDWETREHRRFEIIPEAGLGIRALPFEATVTNRNMPVNGTISTSYLEMQRRMPPTILRRHVQHGASQSLLRQEDQPPPEIVISSECHDQLAVVDETRQAGRSYDESSIESSFFSESRDEYEYDDDMREDAALETRETLNHPCTGFKRS